MVIGYWDIGLDDKRFYAHQLAWLYVHGVWPKAEIDHINMDRADNRLVNLREATKAQNNFRRKLQSNNKSGRTGVSFCTTYGYYVVKYFETANNSTLAVSMIAKRPMPPS